MNRKTEENVETYIGDTVESFLRSHPNAALDIMSPDGFIFLTPEEGQALLNGGEVSAHPGDPEYAVKVPADMILSQQIFSIGAPNAKNPNLYAMMVDAPELNERMDQAVIKCKKTPRKKRSFMAERREIR